MRWDPQRELTVRALRVAFADFSAAPWQGFEKSERCPNNSSLFRPQAAVVVVAVQVLAALRTASDTFDIPMRWDPRTQTTAHWAVVCPAHGGAVLFKSWRPEYEKKRHP